MKVRYSESGLGYDPELFIINRSDNIVPFSLLPSLHKKTTQYHDRGPLEWKVDGVAAELNGPEHYCRDYLVPNLAYALWNLHQNLLAFNSYKQRQHKLSLAPIGRVAPTTLARLAAKHKELGCNPDTNGYTLNSQQPDSKDVGNFRTTGGHIHFSYPGLHTWDERQLALYAVYCDFWLGLPSVVMLGKEHQEEEVFRRQFYGKAGSFRKQKWGIEYRTLSSRGFLQSPVWTFAMFENMRSIGLGLVVDTSFFTPSKELVGTFEELEDIVNNHRVEQAISFWHKNKELYRLPDWRKHDNYGIKRTSKTLFPFGSELISFLMNVSDGSSVWSDDFLFNWGLTSANKSLTNGRLSHNYWGDISAMEGVLSETIFPLRSKLATSKTPIKFHPSDPEAQKKNAWSY